MKNYYIQKINALTCTSADTFTEFWIHTDCYIEFIILCWLHITMCWSQYHDVSYKNCLLDLKWLVSVFCYNYFFFKENVHISTFVSFEKFEIMLCEYNIECTMIFAFLNHYELFSLNQSNHSYSMQLSVSWFYLLQFWFSLN